jgi:hypothetical protein
LALKKELSTKNPKPSLKKFEAPWVGPYFSNGLILGLYPTLKTLPLYITLVRF